MAIVLDCVLVFIVCGLTLQGYRKGLVRCLLKILSSIMAIIIAIFLYRPFVNYIIDNTNIDDNIQTNIEERVKSSLVDKGEGGEVVDNDSGISSKPVVDYLNQSVESEISKTKESAAKGFSVTLARLIIEIVCFVTLFLAVNILLRALTGATGLITSLPVIKQFNRAGGAVFGIIEALIVIYVLLALVSVALPAINSKELGEAINNTIILKEFYNNNLLLKIIF